MHTPPVTTNTAPHLNQKKTNKNRAQTTTTRARPRPPPPTVGAPITVLLLSLIIICHYNPVRPRQILPPLTKLPQACLLLFNPDAPFNDKPTRNTRPFSAGVYSSISKKWNKNTKPNPAAASASILNTATQAPLPTSPSAPAFSSAKTITSLTTKGKPEAPLTVFALLSSQTTAQLTTKTSRMTATNPGRERALIIPQDLMAIQTSTAGTKTRAAKANVSAVIHPCRSTRSTSRSPRGENVNDHLAKLSIPGSHFDGGLTVLGKGGQGNIDNPDTNSDAPGYLSPMIKKGNLPGPPDSPTGVDAQDEAHQATAHNVSPQGSDTSDTQPSPRSRSVRISDTVHAKNTIRGVTQGTSNSPKTATRQLILMTSSRHSPTDRDPHKEGEEDTPTKE
jgi:hypothetical protein